MTDPKPSIRVQVPMTIGDNVRVLMTTFDGLSDGGDHFAYVFNRGRTGTPLVRVHSSCVTGDIFGSHRCDCGDQLRNSIEELDRQGGILIYLGQEGRGIGLKAKIDAYALQIGRGLDTYAANRALGHDEDKRDYRPAAEILNALGGESIILITGNPDKARQLRGYGINVVSVKSVKTRIYEENRAYLAAKEAHGHTIIWE